jgi:putative oxidoreductase
LLRLGTGIFLVCLGFGGMPSAIEDPILLGRDLIASATGISLLLGLWTPAAGALAAINEISSAWLQHTSGHDARLIHLLLALVTTGIAMLGPGAWSIDARLYGRKRFNLGHGLEKDPSKE